MEATKLNPNKCLINIPSAELKNIEREFWARIDVSGAIFVGGSLGKKKAGVSAFALSNNSRLVALGLNNGQILVYDMIYQNKPQLNGDNLEDSEGELLLIRFVTGLKAAVTHIEFSSDWYSQLLVMFDDGTVRVFSINDPILGSSDKCKYAKKEQIAQKTVFQMTQKFAMNSSFWLSNDEESNNIKLNLATFYPSFSFTGIQHSYLLNCLNGLLVKINTNMDYKKEQKDLSLFNRALAPIAAPEEQPFPRGKYPFYKSKSGKKGLTTGTERDLSKKNIDREFFTGHRYRVLLVSFIDGGSTMVSIDTKGYIYLWVYDKSSFTSEIHFKPSIKLKLELNFTQYMPESSVRIFPPGKEKEINYKKREIAPQTMQRIGDFMSSLNTQDIKEKSLATYRDEQYQTTQFFVPTGDIPEEYGVAVFVEYLFNIDSLCIRAAENRYQAQPVGGNIIDAKMSKDQKYLIVHCLKDHTFSVKKREIHEFVVVKLLGKRLNTTKVSFDYLKGTKIEYDISNEIPPYDLPYLYMIRGSSVVIASLVTGQIVNKFDYSEILTQQIRKSILFDNIVTNHYTSMFMTSENFDSALLLKIQNNMNYEDIDNFSKFRKVFYDIWNSDGPEQLRAAFTQPLPN